MRSFLVSYGLEIVLVLAVTTLFWLGIKVKKHLTKHLFFNTCAICFVLLIYEFYLTRSMMTASTETTYSNKYVIQKPGMGYGIRDSIFSVRAKKKWPSFGETIYDVKYSFSDGRRQTPNSDSLSHHQAIFLGGSFMFGEGLEDDETLPYYFNDSAEQKWNIKNYGFQGYGTHQAFTIVKNQLLNDTLLLNGAGTDVFYWSIDAHIARANGHSSWDREGPKYTIRNGDIEHIGTFRVAEEKQPFVVAALTFLIDNSAIYSMWFEEILSSQEKDLDLYLGLIRQMDQLFKQNGVRFTVLTLSESEGSSWPFYQHYHSIAKTTKLFFKEFDIRYVDVNQVVKEQGLEIDSLVIVGDGHPTGRLNKLLAGHLQKKIN